MVVSKPVQSVNHEEETRIHSQTTEAAAVAAELQKLLVEPKVDDHRADAVRLDQARRVLAQQVLVGDLEFSNSIQQKNAQAKWCKYLKTCHDQLVSQLERRIRLGQRTALRTLWGVMAASPLTLALPAAATNDSFRLVNTELLVVWLRALTYMSSSDFSHQTVQHMISVEFIKPHRDVQYYLLVAITRIANEIYQQLEQVTMDAKKKDNEAFLALQTRSERLVNVLMMIEVATSQKADLDQGSYLFASSRQFSSAALGGVHHVYEEEDGDNDDSSQDSDHDDEEDSDEDEDEEERPTKRPKSAENSQSSPRHQFPFQQIKSHRRMWANAWLAVLRLPLSTLMLKRVMQYLPVHVIPVVVHPLRFADFFMTAFDNDASESIVAVLSLEGLFLLITQHGLEYPRFYEQLYTLVTPALMHVKYRIRFFQLLDKCLSRNEMLPAHITAAFMKRLLRCCLSAPPTSILFALALVSNLLRKRPETSALVHRGTVTNNESRTPSGEAPQPDYLLHDAYDAETNDPSGSKALQSSLWELLVLEKHYLPAVQTLARSVGVEDDGTAGIPLHDLQQDFVGHTYRSLFEQERKRHQQGKRSAKATALTFHRPPSLFSDTDSFAGVWSIRSQLSTVVNVKSVTDETNDESDSEASESSQ
jgi:U3 small nucleolar RNA-associated protein 19